MIFLWFWEDASASAIVVDSKYFGLRAESVVARIQKYLDEE